MNLTEQKNWTVIFQTYAKLFQEKNPDKSDALFKLVKKLQFGGK